ncbi:MAG TPA: hypothetical protein VF786_13720 [Terriglobales bacterium]
MTDQELQELRAAKWRLNGQPILTLDDAREFMESVGFCLMYPLRPPVLVPTFIGACVGAEQNLPTWQHAFAHPRNNDAKELMVRTLRQRTAFEANLFGESNFLVAASVFPFFYGLVGDRNPRQAPKTGGRSDYSPLAAHTFQVIQKEGPITKSRLAELLGGALSTAALDRALNELWSKLRITRVDYNPEEGAFWDILFRWAPDPVREGMNMSLAEALTALVSKYLDCVVAAEQSEVEDFFSNFIGRARVREAVNALLAARELQFTHVGARSLLQVTPPRLPAPVRVPRPPHRDATPRAGQPIARRPMPRAKTTKPDTNRE